MMLTSSMLSLPLECILSVTVRQTLALLCLIAIVTGARFSKQSQSGRAPARLMRQAGHKPGHVERKEVLKLTLEEFSANGGTWEDYTDYVMSAFMGHAWDDLQKEQSTYGPPYFRD